MIDVEALLANYLRVQPEVIALIGDRVYTDLPHKRTYPLVVLSRTGGGYLTKPPLWLEEAEITLEAYGGTHKQAQVIASTCLDIIGSSLRGQHPEGCVTGVRNTSVAYDPDTDLADPEGHSRPRYTVTANVLAHP